MELIRSHYNLKPKHKGCAITIGNFDGVHLGHQSILSYLANKAKSEGLATAVIVFEPQPQEYFSATTAPPRLTRLREKIRALSQHPIDYLLILRFNAKLAQMAADTFIKTILVDGLGVQYLTIGDDFRFGKNRTGNLQLLQTAGRQYGFQVEHMATYDILDERVSSTRIRTALRQGDLRLAEQLLGRPYRLCGRVAHGNKRGRSIGFPTANIHLHRKITPVLGVYAVQVLGLGTEPVYGVANVGQRPTINGTFHLLEVHLFDFAETIYGRYLQVDLLHRIRDEQRFESFEMLRQQIDRDAQTARDLLLTTQID